MVKKIENGIRFNGKHSFTDYGMFLSARPDVGQPEANTFTVAVTGADGVLDLTESVTGRVTYKNRTCTFVFVTEVEPKRQSEFKSRLLNELHGKTVEVELDEDAGWIYTGRAKVAFTEVTTKKIKTTITVDAEPYKVAREETELFYEFPNSFEIDTVNNKATRKLVGFERDFSSLSEIHISWETAIDVYEVAFEDSSGVIGIVYSGPIEPYTSITVPFSDLDREVDLANIVEITIYGISEAFEIEERPLRFDYMIGNDFGVVFPSVKLTGASLTAIIGGTKVLPANADLAHDENIYLTGGDNQISFQSGGFSGQTVTLKFRKRRL